MRPSNEILVSAGVLDATFNGLTYIPLRNVLSISVQLVVTGGGTPVGTFKLQYSNDQPVTGSPTNWSDIANATAAITDDGVFSIGKTDVCFEWMRLVWTRTSGVGFVTARVKSLGV